MAKAPKSVWFEGSNQINCDLTKVRTSLENPGEHFAEMVSGMPGITSAELIEQGDDFVIIKTNEGQMRRYNITLSNSEKKLVLEFDEEYTGGKAVTTNTHFQHIFTTAPGGIEHSVVVSDVKATGILGFFYKNFGSSNMGKAFLETYKTYLEK